MIPEGSYRARPVPVDIDGTMYYMQLGATPNGKEYARVVLDLGAHGKMAWDGWLTTDKGETRTVEALRLMGWKGTNILEAQVAPLTNEVIAVVKHDADQQTGELRARIAFINDPNGGFHRVKPENRIAGDAAARLQKRLAKVIAATPAPTTNGSPDNDALPDWVND